jgi:phosphatidylglycerol---prolipoprotein diacylglyceryl transferase
VRPVLFQFRGFKAKSYPGLVYAGMVAGILAAVWAAHVGGLDTVRVYLATMILMIPGVLGARWFYVASHWKLYRDDPRRALQRRNGGAALYGGLALALPCSLPVLAGLGLALREFWDVSVFTMLVIMIFGRVGCLLNGCCAGRPSESWMGIRLPNHCGVWRRRIPTQCLEAAWGVMLLVAALLAWRRMPFPGALFLTIAGGYALGRLALESTREETMARRFTVNHAISVLILVIALLLLAVRWRKQQEVVRWRTISPATLMS